MGSPCQINLASPSHEVPQVFLLPFQNSVVLNNKAEIILHDAVGTNGVIHVINQILVPPRMQDFPPKKVCAVHCHSQPTGFSTVTVSYINHISHQKKDIYIYILKRPYTNIV